MQNAKKMNRKNFLYIGIFLGLLALSIIILSKNKSNKADIKPDAFRVTDTASIKKIFIADMKGQKVILSKQKNNEWLVNDKYVASLTKIESLLEVLAKIEIKNPVPESAKENVVRSMAAGAVKVELYHSKKRKPFHVFFVGGPTQDMLGTYMALAKKNRNPYVVHIPGWNGYLSDGYFFAEAKEWRSKAVFHFKVTDIQSIKVQYSSTHDSSYEIFVKGMNDFRIFNPTNRNSIPFNKLKVKSYLQLFSDINFLNTDNNISKHRKDSIIKSIPIITIEVTNKQNKLYKLSLYYKPSNLQTKAEIYPGIDKEYFYAVFSERSDEILIIQTLQISTILWLPNNFL